MASLKATIIVPTSIDRGPLLPYSVGSILNQTIRELEVFIIGDGVEEVTREAARALVRQDARVKFFDHPKGPRRGEIYRHEALQEARGEIVCYLCDRDMMLPDHVETLLELLKNADFAHTLPVTIKEDGRAALFEPVVDLASTQDRAAFLRGGLGFPLSFGAHTLAAYRQLPHGWRTTPPGHFTDQYMWQQLLAQPGCRAISDTRPTILYFPRGAHPGLDSAGRLRELQRHHGKITNPAAIGAFRTEIAAQWTTKSNPHTKPSEWLTVIRRRIPNLLRSWIRQAMGRATR